MSRPVRSVRVLSMGLLPILVTGCSHRTAPTPPGQVAKVVPMVRPIPPPVVTPDVSALALYRPISRILGEEPSAITKKGERKVALTFDAGSDDTAVNTILEHLKKHHAKATFFMTGHFCELYPGSCRAIADAGMEIGNHSYSHPHFPKRTDAEIRAQLDKADAAITKACGRSTKPLFRFPYGDCNPRSRRAVARAGYQAIGWSLDSLDSVGRAKSTDFVVKRILKKIGPGYITLMHVEYPQTAAALPPILAYLEKEHIEAVPVSALVISTAPATGKTNQKNSEPDREKNADNNVDKNADKNTTIDTTREKTREKTSDKTREKEQRRL